MDRPMEPTHQNAIIGDMLEPFTDLLTPESAKQFASLKVKPSVQARVDELAAKANEGELTDAEQQEYETIVQVGNIFALLKAKAKKVASDLSNA
jgi:hypothetical protein